MSCTSCHERRTLRSSILKATAGPLVLLTVGASTGCFVPFLLAARAMEAKYRQDALTKAPPVANPRVANRVEEIPSVDGGGHKTVMTSYSPEAFCFRSEQPVSPRGAEATSYLLRSLQHVKENVDTVPTATSRTVRVLDSDSRVTFYDDVVQDTIRDGSGQVIATQERVVQRQGIEYNTTFEICFPATDVPGEDTRVIELLSATPMENGKSLWAAWRFGPDAPPSPPPQGT